MLAKVHSSLTIGVEGHPLEVEVDITAGLPVFSTVGLPEGAVRESKDRVKAAIRNCGYEFPHRRITVNLAPADLKKEGTGYDLPIALGILAANGLIAQEALAGYSMIGELSLDGRVRSVRGVLPMVLAAREAGMRAVIVPAGNAREAGVVGGIGVYPVGFLHEAVELIRQERQVEPYTIGPEASAEQGAPAGVDFAEVKGQEHAKRALEIAASGKHNVLFKGPPGAGKTMLARRLATILPPLSFDEALETTKIHSIAGILGAKEALVRQRPFRAPHHTISDAGLIGGGSTPRPGEVSLANTGVLFLDELTEFRKRVLEMLRQPLEERSVTIARANMTLSFPADFILIGAYNPCPCGYYGDKSDRCRCSEVQIQRYIAKLSGPLLDRMDIHLEIAALAYKEMAGREAVEDSAAIRKRVEDARSIQQQRYAPHPGVLTNGDMSPALVEKYCQTDDGGRRLLEKSVERLGLSARAYHRILKIARTIADLDGAAAIASRHVAEAVQYRRTN